MKYYIGLFFAILAGICVGIASGNWIYTPAVFLGLCSVFWFIDASKKE